MSLNYCIIGTDTEVGKTQVSEYLCTGLRMLQRKVWMHKPVACGDWQDEMADDGRTYHRLADKDQDPQTICPLQFPEACSPHLAAEAAGVNCDWRDMAETINGLKSADHDLIVEGAGGLLAPLSTDYGCIVDIALACDLDCLLVTRPHLGTLNHTQLTVCSAQRRGLSINGIVINYHEPDIDKSSLAVRTAKEQIERLCQIPVVAELPYSEDIVPIHAQALAERLCSMHA